MFLCRTSCPGLSHSVRWASTVLSSSLFKKVVKRKDPVARKYVDRVICAPHVRSWQDTEMQGVRVHMQGDVPSAAKVESHDDMAFLQCEG